MSRKLVVKSVDLIAKGLLMTEGVLGVLKLNNITYCPEPDFYSVVDENGNVLLEKNGYMELNHLASTNKILVARVLLYRLENQRASLTDEFKSITTTLHPWDLMSDSLGGNIELMLRKSSNTATNLLIDYLGGFDSINRDLKELGFDNTALHSYTYPSSYAPQFDNQKSKSSAVELGRALTDIYKSHNSLFVDALNNSPYQYTNSNRVINKVGVNSWTFANVATIRKNGKIYTVSVFYYTFSPKIIKLFTLTSETLVLQKSTSLCFKWDPCSAFVQKVINRLN